MFTWRKFTGFTNINKSLKTIIRNVSYVQGQSPESKIREYFYYIDHQGMLFLDDARIKNFTSCFKDKQFLVFFFKRVRHNTTGRYEEDFPFISLCGRERNFIRCDDRPIVFTHVTKKDGKDVFCYGHAGDLLHEDFLPDHLYMNPETGRVYHPAAKTVGSIALVQSKLAIEFSRYFKFDNGENKCPTHFTWNGKTYVLNTNWYRNLT